MFGVPFEDIKIGMSASYSQTITDTGIKAFASLSGDRNPVHLDELYANNSRYKKRIAQGLLAASFFSVLFGTRIPREGCVYVAQSLQFKRPVYINDTVVATLQVININSEKRRVFLKQLAKLIIRL